MNLVGKPPNDMKSDIGRVNTLSETTIYQQDPLAAFNKVCGNNKNSLLLESSEIESKKQLKSILIVDSALKIVCNGLNVSFTALTINGHSVLPHISDALISLENINDIDINESCISVTFNPGEKNLDEASRLQIDNPFSCLRLFSKLENETGSKYAIFLGGVFSFDMIANIEELPPVEYGDNTCPDYTFYLAETLLVIDHEERCTNIYVNTFSGKDFDERLNQSSRRLADIKDIIDASYITEQIPANDSERRSNPIVDISDNEFCEIVNSLKENIRAGDIFQVVPSRSFSLPCSDTLNAYKTLKQRNPSPYMFYMRDSDFCIFGASPESAIKFEPQSRKVEIYPIAGTRPRGLNEDGSLKPDLDSRIELDLRLDEKELAEHIMLVDLARNDVARISKAGTRHVADLLKVDRYSHVMHLVSRVAGTLCESLDTYHAYQACMNMGTLSGAPKVKATELIRKVEGKRRGSYGGAVGYITGDGEMDTCIVIRSAFVNKGMAHIQAGAGVVFDSNPKYEADETRHKAAAVISAIQASSKTRIQINSMSADSLLESIE